MAAAPSPTEALRSFFGTYTPADKDWAFQLWLDAWAEAARRPAVQATSRRLNLAWQGLLEATIGAGVADGSFRCADPRGAAWRILSLLDGLALQVVAHGTTVTRADVVAWTTSLAEARAGAGRRDARRSAARLLRCAMVVPSPPPRQVRLVLVSGDDPPLGVLPSFEVAIPWWPEMGPVVDGARERVRARRHGPATARGRRSRRPRRRRHVPRRDRARRPAGRPPLAPWTGRLDDHPRRMPWARPGGPAADLGWADGVLAAAGMPRVGAARQVRSWNLSSLWALPLADGTAAWLKAVPPFFAHEGAVLERLAGRPVPTPARP